jgi:hypothetical protein
LRPQARHLRAVARDYLRAGPAPPRSRWLRVVLRRCRYHGGRRRQRTLVELLKRTQHLRKPEAFGRRAPRIASTNSGARQLSGSSRYIWASDTPSCSAKSVIDLRPLLSRAAKGALERRAPLAAVAECEQIDRQQQAYEAVADRP